MSEASADRCAHYAYKFSLMAGCLMGRLADPHLFQDFVGVLHEIR